MTLSCSQMYFDVHFGISVIAPPWYVFDLFFFLFFFLRSGKSKRGREFGDSSLHRSERCRLQGPNRELGLLTASLYTVQMYSSASPSTCDHLTDRSRAETPSPVHATPVCLCTVSLWCSLYHSSTPCKNTPNWVSVKVPVISKRRHIYQNISESGKKRKEKHYMPHFLFYEAHYLMVYISIWCCLNVRCDVLI